MTLPEFPVWSPTKYEDDTVTAALARAVSAFADRIFLDFDGVQHTYAEVDRLSTRLARGLQQCGVSPGQTVASILDNNLEGVLVWLAANKLGAISVPVNTAYKGEFLRHQVADSGAAVMIAETDYVDRLNSIAGSLPDLKLVLQRGEAPLVAGALPVASLSDALDENETPLDHINTPTDLAILIYTSGTTGPSKGCMISHNYFCNNARQILHREKRTQDTINWTPLPLFHMNALAGSILSSMMVGARVAISPRFSVSRFWPEIERSGATVVNLLGSMIAFIADAPDSEVAQRCFGQLHAVRGSPFSPELQAKWKARFGVTYAGSNTYGLTEAARVTTLADGDHAPPGSSGRANDDFDVRIFDSEDNEAPVGVAGEVVIRPRRPHVMFEGYWRRPEATQAVMRNMWLHAGDIGKFDAEGFFYFVDRKKDYLRRRGENISSHEVETALKAHPAIADLAVHAVFASDMEDEVKVTAMLKGDAALTEEDFCRWSILQLPYFAVPRYFEFRSDLPRSPTGKVLKYVLREDGCTAATWDREKSGIVLTKR
jgi:crotonobetaine/carnitine-CoA ligase